MGAAGGPLDPSRAPPGGSGCTRRVLVLQHNGRRCLRWVLKKVPSPKSAVGMAFDPVAFKKTKHILRAAEFLRDLVAREVVSVEHLPGAVMLADILTKAASRAVFVELIKQLDTFVITSVAL